MKVAEDEAFLSDMFRRQFEILRGETARQQVLRAELDAKAVMRLRGARRVAFVAGVTVNSVFWSVVLYLFCRSCS